MRRAFGSGLVALVALLAGCAATDDESVRPLARPAPPTLTTLEPGGFRSLDQELTVNVVFVGYEQGAGAQEIDESAFLAELPASAGTVARYKELYGLPGDLGIDFAYDANVVYADTTFEDAFFGYLGSIAETAPPTLYQQRYNTQGARSLTIAGNNTIDAPSVEQWLADNAGPALNIDTSDYTVFLVNWYGRADFRHHVYTKTDEPDPDTGMNFGEVRDSRKVIAWGGTTPDDEESGLGSLHRIWFYDLSAGPESWTDNWDVDDADLDGDGVMDYRMPPVWEYGNASGYRAFDDLSGDLGKVVRYVALDLLFTPSPLYNPALSPPVLPSDIQLDVNVYQADPASDGTGFFVPSLIAAELGELQPLNTFSVELSEQTFDSRFETVYDCFYDDVSCFGQRLFGIAFADLFLYHEDTLMQYLEGDADYEVPVFAFNTTDDRFTCCLGFADDNWADGTQSFVFAFDSPSVRDVSGYGFTTTTIHEVGHHLGMSHPHDGYDYATGVDFGPEGATYFAWSGDEVNSMMSYIDLNWDFSQFDRDNMNRYLTSAYLNQANVVLAEIVGSPRVAHVAADLVGADALAADALAAYDTMDYASAAAAARAAYDDVLAAAAAIHVQVEPQAWPADYKAKAVSPKFVDGVAYLRKRMAP